MKTIEQQKQEWMSLARSSAQRKKEKAMFKVICISPFGSVNDDKGALVGVPHPKVLEPCTVVKTEIDPKDGCVMYYLAEYPGNPGALLYDARCFARLNGPCEVAIAEERIAADAAELDAEWYSIVHEEENA